jgi:LysR family cys regulon transcriptional activator
MNLRQLRFVREAVRQNLKLTAVAQVLHTSQPGVSKSIIELEEELGVKIFTRRGKRLSAVTVKGRLVVAVAERILREVDALKRVVADDANQGEVRVDVAREL